VLGEQLGFDFCSVGHHSFTPEGGTESAPFAFLSAVAARTSTIRLVTGIYILPLHHPVAVAEQLATLDVISNGRAVMGVGAGYRDYEFKAFGVDIKTRGARLDESIRIIKSAFAKGNWAYDGTFWQLDELPLQPAPVQAGGPPIWIGGSSEAAIRRAGRIADGWMSDNMLDIDAERKLADLYRISCVENGRPAGEVCILRTAWCAATRAEAEAAVMPPLRQFLAHYKGANAGSGTLPWNADMFRRIACGEHVPIEEYTKGQALAGTPDDIIPEVIRWRDEVGADSIELMLSGPQDFESVRDMLTLFAKEVMPAV
jgi:probable F420-dependent oxidoreductase